MSGDSNSGGKPRRTLIAYCALAERLSKPKANMFQALVPFFAEACQELAGEMFDANKFSQAVRRNFGIEIPKLAALGIAEQLAGEGILEIVAGYAQSTTYRYSVRVRDAGKDVSPVTEAEVEKILALFSTYCQENAELTAEQVSKLNAEFLDRLLNIDSMRLLARRDASITMKRSSETLQLVKNVVDNGEVAKHSLHLDFLVSSFLIDIRENNAGAFEVISNIAFASMAAEAIACFREPQQDAGDLSGLTVLLDTPLVLDMLGVNFEYAEYGKELLQMLKESGCNIAVLDHSVAEAENSVTAKLGYMRSGVNQLTAGSSVRPSLLAALSGNIAERVESRLEISIKRDPEVNLHRRSQNTVGDIEADMNSRMAAWRNEDAKQHDRKSVWALISLRDSTNLQPRICKSGWLLLTRNTPLLRISNDSWRAWLKGATKHSPSNIERWAPVAMSDKQFAGYVWARTGGGASTIPKTLLLAHCSAAVRPRADVKAKAYNLLLEMYGQEEAQDLIALFEDREGGRALMKATLGDPEDVTPQRMSLILEKVKLAAGEFAAAHARDEAAKELENERQKSASTILKIQDTALLETKREREDKDRIILEMFAEQQRASALEIESKNLKADIKNKEQQEIARRELIVEKGLKAGNREYWGCRWLLVLLFGLTTWVVSANILELTQGLNALLSIVISIFGYWFVPDFLEPVIRSVADRRFRSFLNHMDPNIDFNRIDRNYKDRTWAWKRDCQAGLYGEIDATPMSSVVIK